MRETSAFHTVRRAMSLSDQVTNRLTEMVTAGDLKVGEMLPSESTLAKAMGVSRTVVREAVSRLKADGLLSSQQGRGVFVAATWPQRFAINTQDSTDIEQILRIVELRMGLEVEAAVLAAQRHTEKDLEIMHSAQAAYQAAVASGDISAGVEADMAFHRAINMATDNEHYVAFFNFLSGYLKETISVGRRKAASRQGGGLDAVEEHHAILDAIAAGDTEAARAAAHYHISSNMRRISSSNEDMGGSATIDAKDSKVKEKS